MVGFLQVECVELDPSLKDFNFVASAVESETSSAMSSTIMVSIRVENGQELSII